MVEVTVVGAGLAGLACARHLAAAGVTVEVLESGDAVGGRVRTDRVDGMLLDRGFQVHNTGYPEAERVLDHDALQLQAFSAGALLRLGDRLHRLGDPRREPRWLLSTALAPIGSLKDKALIALVAGADAVVPVDRLLRREETTTLAALRARGFSETTIDRFLRPFLAGVFLEDELSTSSRFFDMIWRSFVRGTQCVPAGGMGAIPAQLAAALPAGTVQLDRPVSRVAAGQVDGRAVRAVVVAAGPQAAADLLPGLDRRPANSVVTHYHLAPVAPLHEPAIVLDAERSGPVANTVVLTNAAPSYAPGRHLVSSSVVTGSIGSEGASEPVVRAHLARLYDVDTSGWEHVATYDVREALPSQAPPMGAFSKPVRLEPGLYVCGDHRDSSSIQGALVSGRRAATAVLADLAGTGLR